MNTHKIFLYLSLPILGLTSCSSELEESGLNGDVKHIEIVHQDAFDGNETRSNFVYDNGQYLFSWTDGDVIGICPSVGDQLSFSIPNEFIGKKDAAFDGGGWSMKASYTYTAYSPFCREAYVGDLSEIPVSYLGQTQMANESAAHLGAYDYSVSDPKEVSVDGRISFVLNRIGHFMRFGLTLPEAGTFSQLVVESDNKPFITKGTIDARSGSKVVTPVETSNTLHLYLNDIVVPESNKFLNLFMLVAPQDLSTSNLTVKLLTKVEAGKYKEYKLENTAVLTSLAPDGAKNYNRPKSPEIFVCTEHPASDYPYPPMDGVTGSADDFILVQ